MNPADAYALLVQHQQETALVTSIAGLVYWDEQTYCPPAAIEYRGEQAAYLAGTAHRRNTAPEVGEWLEHLAGSDLAADANGAVGANVRELRRRREKLTKIPQALVEEIARTASQSHQAWAAARKANDFAAFRPWLEKMLRLRVEQAEAVGYAESPYDALVDDYEPGETAVSIATVLDALQTELTPLVRAIVESGRTAPSEVLARSFPVAAQAEFGKAAAAAIGFDFDAGRLDTTHHPFCGGAGPRDVRLTTRYNEHDFGDGFFSILHEAGHGIYEQGLDAAEYGMPAGEAMSLAIHESQSRMWENLVGRSYGFWRRMYPAAQRAFPAALGDVTLDDYYFAVNESKPSLIRTESDEATYNLHVCIRFRLERALVEGRLAVADLPGAWNEAYRETLGIVSPTDANGCLQDVHWSEGMFGYFPTYALGNLHAAQLFEAAGAELGDLDAMFALGEFRPLLEWLRRNVHAVGQRDSAARLVQRVTGAPLSAAALLRRLRTKFGALYGVAFSP
ncbi:MAG: carboxypeptidase M32 [Lacipirellulaceae bacterium]